MSDLKYEKCIIRSPKLIELAHHAKGKVSGFTYPYLVYMDEDLMKGSPVFIDLGWRTAIPNPNPVSEYHSHTADEILMYMGSDPGNPQDLGAEIEITLNAEKYKIDTTCAVFIPSGVKHTIKVTKFKRPFLNIGIEFRNRYD